MYTYGPVLHKAHPLPHNMQKAMEVEEYEIYMYAFKSMVRGYHVYQEMWVADVGEELSCVKETENHRDPFSVAVVRFGVTVSQVPTRERGPRGSGSFKLDLSEAWKHIPKKSHRFLTQQLQMKGQKC